ncbi:hypothetical protein V5O48_000756 [Marasmius crinis-equi]|uniref:ER transporter 6TM N-terminal domain-containing protein n=1 Tax=Marasmius crinis-equi TaxID=585013 RepID=A0ABR3G0R4_9AGAR
MADHKDKEARRRKPEGKGKLSSPGDSDEVTSSSSSKSSFGIKLEVPASLQWIPNNWKWSNIKVALRCAVAAWLALLLFVIPTIEVYMGQAAFLILIASILSPPSDPFLIVIEREVLIMAFVAATWGWCCLGMRLADLARTNRQPEVTLATAITSGGKYVEAGPTVILAVFMFLGTVILLYVRARKGPGPYLFACILSCICLTISLTTSALIPYPYYNIGRSIIVPLGFHSAIAVLTAILMFPQTVSAQFTSRMHNVFTPLVRSIELHRELLKMPSSCPDFAKTSETLSEVVSGAEAALTPVAVAGRLLPTDLIYNRFSPMDYKPLHVLGRRMAVRANGMAAYWSLIDPLRERFPVTPAPSRPGTPGTMTPVRSRAPSTRASRAASPERSPTREDDPPASGIVTSLEDAYDPKNPPETPTSATPTSHRWLLNARKGRWSFWKSRKTKEDAWKKNLEALQTLRDTHEDLLSRFKAKDRLIVTEPWKVLFEMRDTDVEVPSHRYLFHCYVYQYHLMRFSTMIMEMLDEVVRLEKERRHHRLWTPAHRMFRWGSGELTDNALHHDEEDPDMIQGMSPGVIDDLGLPRRRDPDALPPRNGFEWVVSHLYRFVVGLGGGNALYAVKAGILTTIMCLPSFIQSTAQFAYNNRFVWAIIMAQLTLARFRGDTTFGQVVRIMSTFLGGILGMLLWYISTGSGNGSPYGLAAVGAVTFPFIFYLRLYWPGPPMTILIFLVTTFLIIGYSYQDSHIVLPGNPGVGWDVAWRRFVLVTSGVTAAFLFSFFPPSYTIRRYQRATLATTGSEIGSIYCAILSYASSRDPVEDQEIVTSLVAIRSKLNRSAVLKANAIYEFSLRGRWPAKRYHRVLEIQLQLTYSLSHLLSIIEHLEPSWTRAFLSRTRFSDPDFQGDILAVISMISTALRTGSPLPQITPCPLINRFMLKYHGLNVVSRDDEHDYGLPRTLTPDTLENEQYMIFCVGVSIAFGIVTRLDRLMVAVKEIVGEDYHIHGVGLSTSRNMGVELGPRTSTIPYRAPENV